VSSSPRQVRIVTPHGAPAYGGALEWVKAMVVPPEGFEGAEVAVDGVPVVHVARSLSDCVALSAWCDSRGQPPGLHAISVTAHWAGGVSAYETRLLVVGVGSPAAQWPAAGGDAEAVGVTRIGASDLTESLAETAGGGPPLVILGDDCELADGARERIAAAFGDGDTDVVIGDEAARVAGGRWLRWRKEAFQPEALPCADQVGPLLAVGPRAAEVLRGAGGAPAGIYGLALELIDSGLSTVALPQVLALTPEARMPHDDEQQREAVRRLATRRGREVRIEAGAVTGLRDVRWPVADPPAITAVVPSRTPELAARCLAGLADCTDHVRLRVVIVDSSGDPEAMLAAARTSSLPASVVGYPAGERFNYQRAVNIGWRKAGDADVLFLNDDVRPLRPDWLMRMAELLTLPRVGVVGALLRHPDGRIQHAGARTGAGFGHRYHDAPGDARGHRLELMAPGNFEAVTGACMLVGGDVLAALGGHDERYVHVCGDVDLCFRAAELGWRVAWCPGAELEHLESATYGTAVNDADLELFYARWRRDRDSSPSFRVRA
jgi:GT2 family glycosyltransferase